jgi:hypothetical protein
VARVGDVQHRGSSAPSLRLCTIVNPIRSCLLASVQLSPSRMAYGHAITRSVCCCCYWPATASCRCCCLPAAVGLPRFRLITLLASRRLKPAAVAAELLNLVQLYSCTLYRYTAVLLDLVRLYCVVQSRYSKSSTGTAVPVPYRYRTVPYRTRILQLYSCTGTAVQDSAVAAGSVPVRYQI